MRFPSPQDLCAEFDGLPHRVSIHQGGSLLFRGELQAGQGEDIDFSHDSGRGLPDVKACFLGEDLFSPAPRDSHPVLKVGRDLFGAQGFQVDSHGKPGRERGEDVSLEDFPQVRKAHQDEREEGAGVFLEVEEDMEVLQDRKGEQMGLVQDQDRVDSLVFGEFLEVVLDVPEEARGGGFWLQAEGHRQLAIEIAPFDPGVVDVGHPKARRVEVVFQGSKEEGLARPRIPGEDRRGLGLHCRLEALLGVFEGFGEKEVGEVHFLGEGDSFECVSGADFIHRRPPPPPPPPLPVSLLSGGRGNP